MTTKLSDKPKLKALPPDLLSLLDYETIASDFINPEILAYIHGGSGSERVIKANVAAFSSKSILSRILTDCSRGSTMTSLLGCDLPFPIGLAPVASHKLVHPDGELAAARGAKALGALMVVSTLASCKLEDIARETGNSKWFQIYFQPRKEDTLNLVRRAEDAGYRAIVVTVDTPIQPASLRALKAGFTMPQDVIAVNTSHQPQVRPVNVTQTESVVFQGMMRGAPNWSDLEWLIAATRLPVVVKGVLHPEDAKKVVSVGAQGIIVSNHGGRALEATPASLFALPQIRDAVGQNCCVMLDGGIRRGSDVLLALAMGADMVFVGRPQLFALSVAGSLGVAHMLKLLKEELEVSMALAGCPDIPSARQCCVVDEALY